LDITKIAIASDHAGFDLKEHLKNELNSKGIEVIDFGPSSTDKVDYPDFAHLLAQDIREGNNNYGILICGSGNGINMTANKYAEIRSALCWNEEIAHLARAHNNANVLALPARFINPDEAVEILHEFLSTEFEGGRHEPRVDKISNNEFF